MKISIKDQQWSWNNEAVEILILPGWISYQKRPHICSINYGD